MAHEHMGVSLEASIDRLKRGDIRGLEPLVRRYQVKAARVAYLITQDAALADDIMQSAFLRVYEHIDQYREELPFEPWLMRIVTNLALKATHRRWRNLDWGLNLDDVFPDPQADPARQFETQERETRVRKALAALKPEQRAVLVYRYYLGYSESEISAIEGSPLGTIRWRFHAAHRKLKRLLEGEES